MKKHYLLYLIFFTYFLNAQWTSNPSVNTLIPNSTQKNKNPSIVSDGAGGAIIVNAVENSSTNIDLIVHKISTAGVVQWETNGVLICSATVATSLPWIVTDGNGGAIICWIDLRNGTYDLYAQRISSSGTILWATNGVLIASDVSINGDTNISVADGNGGAFVSWVNNSRVLVQKISATGLLLWTPVGVSATNSGIQSAQNIISDDANGIIISWLEYGNVNGKYFVQRVSNSGTVLWSQNGVVIQNISNSYMGRNYLTSDNNNGAVLLWDDTRNGSTVDIYAQKINSSGIKQWGNNGVTVCSDPYSQQPTTLFCDLLGNTYFIFDNNFDLYLQRLNSQGIIQLGASGIALDNNSIGSDYAAIMPEGTGGILVSWSETESSVSKFMAKKLIVEETIFGALHR